MLRSFPVPTAHTVQHDSSLHLMRYGSNLEMAPGTWKEAQVLLLCVYCLISHKELEHLWIWYLWGALDPIPMDTEGACFALISLRKRPGTRCLPPHHTQDPGTSVLMGLQRRYKA